MCGDLIRLFPGESREFWKRALLCEEQLQEIRLRAGRAALLLNERGEWMLDAEGNPTRETVRAKIMTAGEISRILQHICHYSPYAFEDEVRQGFVTVSGGHRVGLAGQVVMEGGYVRTIKHISCLNIRVSHQIKGAADGVLPQVYRDGKPQNTLIISPPGCGKTTLLRDLVRQVSDGNPWGRGCSVGVVDERSEIAGCFQGIPQNDVGMRTDVLDGCPKVQGMMMLLRSMSPEVMAVDEIGGSEDIRALQMASRCGCRILATIHGEDRRDVMLREGMGRLFEERLFEKILVLRKTQGKFMAVAEREGAC